jgi:uncharacterized repeat protein (TIGR03803 family)
MGPCWDYLKRVETTMFKFRRLTGNTMVRRAGPLVSKLFFGAVAAASMPGLASAAPSGKTIYKFLGGLQGDTPYGSLIQDSSGAFYGTTSGGNSTLRDKAHGTVFKLTPPSSGNPHWTQTILYAFPGGRNGGGVGPESNLVMDSAGDLFGTAHGAIYSFETLPGGVFELKPPAAPGGAWTESLLVRLGTPTGALLRQGDGVLYGVASSLDQGGNPNYGVAYEVIPPRAGETKWTKRAIYTFKGFTDGYAPHGGLIAGPKGTLYGTTAGGGAGSQGTVFKLSAPTDGGTTWTETILYSFNSYGSGDGAEPYGALLLDSAGNLFGTTKLGGTSNNGTVFELSPPSGGATTWTETILYSFGNAVGQPDSGLIFGPNGTLFGTTSGSLVFQLFPPTGAETKWRFKQLWVFNGNAFGLMGSLLRVRGGDLYGLSMMGGAPRCQNHSTCGTVYEVTP